jgi:hypothetical protein
MKQIAITTPYDIESRKKPDNLFSGIKGLENG